MTHMSFIDTAIIALAAAAPEGTPWDDIVRDAHELAAARARAVPQAPVKVRPAGGRLSAEERAARHHDAKAAVLAMIQAAPGQRFPGGMYELARCAPCGRNAAVTACRRLEETGAIRFGTQGGRKYTTLGAAPTHEQSATPTLEQTAAAAEYLARVMQGASA